MFSPYYVCTNVSHEILLFGYYLPHYYYFLFVVERRLIVWSFESSNCALSLFTPHPPRDHCVLYSG